ncbi:MAG: hypothetical protein AB7O96_05890 [Pseudobdellovibrionaceae bacterium]
MIQKNIFLGLFFLVLFLNAPLFAENFSENLSPFYQEEEESEHEENIFSEAIDPFSCIKAKKEQISVMNLGNTKEAEFLKGCKEATNNSSWCAQLIRPDPHPTNRQIFKCTYGPLQPLRFIHPDSSTWKNAYQAVNLIKELQAKGISVNEIYNWWRPEPYNKNIGGAPGRHPYGTAVDVQFSSMKDMKNAHKLLCQWRAQGRLRALGYYGTRELHFGIGDANPNTWGKSCK